MTRKITLIQKLFDDESTRKKATVMCAVEIMSDDERNLIPKDYLDTFYAPAGEGIPWGSKFKVTIEFLNADIETLVSYITLNDTPQNRQKSESMVDDYSASDIMSEDPLNIPDDETFEIFNKQPGDGIPWGTECKYTFEFL